MTCQEARGVLSAFHDGELDLVTDGKVREHLTACPGCQAEVDALRSMSAALTQVPRQTASEELRRRVEKSLPTQQPTRGPRLRGTIAAFGVGVAASLAILGLLLSRLGRPSETLTSELLDAHVSAMISGHLMDVASSDRHTLKPWFASRVPISPTAWDLGAQGFPLVGGRLQVVEGHASPVFVYRRQKHWIDLFVLPQSAGSWTLDRQGYTMIAWPSGGMQYVAVSDVDPAALQAFTEAYRRQG